jgi:hypothetical protein
MPEQEEPKRLTFHTVQEVLAESEPEPDWVIESIAAKGSLTTVGGYSGAGKTPLMIRMAKAVADVSFERDREFCGFKASPLFTGRVVYLTEEPRRSFEQGLRSLKIAETDDLPFDVVFWDESFGIPWENIVEQAFHQADGGVLIADTAFRWSSPSLTGGSAENDSATMQKVYGPLVQACRRNTTVVAVAHTRKDFDRMLDDEADIAAIRGSGAVIASSSVVVLYKKPFPVVADNVRLLRVGRTRLEMAAPDDRYVTLTPEGLSTISRLNIEMQKIEAQDEKVLALIQQAQEATMSQLEEAWQGDVRELSRTIKRLREGGRIDRDGGGVRGDPYRYSAKSVGGLNGESNVVTGKEESPRNLDSPRNLEGERRNEKP